MDQDDGPRERPAVEPVGLRKPGRPGNDGTARDSSRPARSGRRIGAIAAAAVAVAVLVGAGFAVAGRPGALVPVTTSTTTTPVPAPAGIPGSAAATTSAAAATSAPLGPFSATIRRETGAVPLEVLRTYNDLDTMAPDWGLTVSWPDSEESEPDLHRTSHGTLAPQLGARTAPVTGPPDVDTCRQAAGYAGAVELDATPVGSQFCVRTNEQRYAWIVVRTLPDAVTDIALQLDVIVWDPPDPALSPDD